MSWSELKREVERESGSGGGSAGWGPGFGLYRGTLRDAAEGAVACDIPSRWAEIEARRPRQDVDLQTDFVAARDSGTQGVQSTDAAVTAAPPRVAKRTEEEGPGRADAGPASALPEEAAEPLVPFLRRVGPAMEDALFRAAESSAFAFRGHASDPRLTAVEATHTLSADLSRVLGPSGRPDGRDANPHALVW